ncbi:MAG TPA: sugar-binding protein [Vicinamibacterales bacterium]|nr:sugar-binding protein [Vicinamibacterales bacterium]
MMRKVFLLAIAAIFGLSGCSGSKAPQSTAQGQRLRFMVIPKAIDLPVFNYAKIGAERQAKEYGNVDILWNGPTTADQLKQKEILESAITQRVDGIAISTLNGDFLTETINKAIDQGIPVVTWDSDAPKSKRIAFYGVDDFAGGRILGEQAVRLLNGKGKVAIITSVGATNLQRRLDGMKEALAKAPGIQIVEVFDIKEDTVRCAELIATGTNRYPDLAAWLSTGGWPVFTRNATAAIDPAKTKLISFDTIQPALDLMRDGKVAVLLGQKYFGWGSEPVKLLYDIKHGKMPPSPIIDSGVDLVTPENLDDYVAKWKKMESGS